MKWEKPSQQILEIFEQIAPEGEGVEKRKMFGYPCRFINNNMFMGVHGEKIFLRLSDQDRKSFLKQDQAQRFEPIPGRIMKEYVVLPQWMLEKTQQLDVWIKRSLAYASGLSSKLGRKST